MVHRLMAYRSPIEEGSDMNQMTNSILKTARSANQTQGILVDPNSFFDSTEISNANNRTPRPMGRTPHPMGTAPVRVPRVASTAPPQRALLGLVLLLVASFALLLVAQAAKATPAVEPQRAPVSVVIVIAQSGDSLWSIARSVQPTGDVRPLVDAMVSMRGTASVFVGDTVAVPFG
jgi:hypothetical protein